MLNWRIVLKRLSIKVDVGWRTMAIYQVSGGQWEYYIDVCLRSSSAWTARSTRAQWDGQQWRYCDIRHSTGPESTQACTLQPTFTGTQTQRYVHKVMRTSSIQPAVSCGGVNIMHKTYNTNGWSVQTLLNISANAITPPPPPAFWRVKLQPRRFA